MNLQFKNKIFLTVFFTVFGIIALQIPFSIVLGSNTKFTLFDYFAPSTGAFLGTIPGIISVFMIQIINIIIHGNNGIDTASLIRLFPTLFAVFYFSKKRTVNIVIPAICMAAFILHPVGRQSWQYSMFWLIPITANFFRKNLFIRSLGATFTAHAVGSVLWIWTFGLTPQIWLALIPQVILERTLFTGGITLFYLFANNLLGLLQKNISIFQYLSLEKQYILKIKN
jgi:hypothetical protein